MHRVLHKEFISCCKFKPYNSKPPSFKNELPAGEIKSMKNTTKRNLTRFQKVQVLTQLGLTSAQSKVYLSLVQTGASTAKMLSKISNVHRPEVYVSLSKLEATGLVEKVIAYPTAYRAAPPNITISSLLQSKIKQNFELQAKTAVLLQEITYKNEIGALTEKPEFVLIPKGEALVNKINAGVKSAEKSICGVSIWKKWSDCFHSLAEEWKKAVKRGVEIRLVTERPEETAPLPEFLKWLSAKNYANCRLRNIPTVVHISMMIFDSKHMLLNTSGRGNLAKAPSLGSSNQCILTVTQNYFETIWKKATPLTLK